MKSKDLTKVALLLILNIALAFAAFFVIRNNGKEAEEALKAEPSEVITVAQTKPTQVIEEKEPEPKPEIKAAEELTLSVYAEYLVIGKSMKIETAVYPSDATVSSIKWESEDSEIATVDSDGIVTAVARGCTYIKAYTDNGVCAVQPIYVMNPGLVFLSPSRQVANYYYKTKISECTQAFVMSGFCKTRLETVGLEVYECPTKYVLEDRGNLAARMKAKCYVAIHTNAGGNEKGTMVFFNRKSEKSVRLALDIYDSVAPVTPDKDSGIKNGVGYKECKFPYEAGVPSVLLEVDFHDKKESAEWLLENGELCGNVIADGIMRFMYEAY